MSPTGMMITTVFAGITLFERSLFLKRTGERTKAVMSRGVAFGHLKKLRPDQGELTC